MKRILYNNDSFKLLKQLDNHENNTNIGLSVTNKEISKLDFKQLLSNGWYQKNNYFLVIENITAESIKTILNMVDYVEMFHGICFTCKLDNNLLKQFIQICKDFNLNCYVMRNNLSNEQLLLEGMKVVEIIYDI